MSLTKVKGKVLPLQEQISNPQDGVEIIGGISNINTVGENTDRPSTDQSTAQLSNFMGYVSRKNDIMDGCGQYVEEFYRGQNTWDDAIDEAQANMMKVDPKARGGTTLILPSGDIHITKPIMRIPTAGTWPSGNKYRSFNIQGTGGRYNDTVIYGDFSGNEYRHYGIIHIGGDPARFQIPGSNGVYGIDYYPAPFSVKDLTIRGPSSGSNRAICHGLLVANTNQGYVNNVTIQMINGAGLLLDNVFDSTFENILFNYCGRLKDYSTDRYDYLVDPNGTYYAPVHVTSSISGGNTNFIRINNIQVENSFAGYDMILNSRSQHIFINDPHFEPGFGNATAFTVNRPSTVGELTNRPAIIGTDRGTVVNGDDARIEEKPGFGGGCDFKVEGLRQYNQAKAISGSTVNIGMENSLDLGSFSIITTSNSIYGGLITHNNNTPHRVMASNCTFSGNITSNGAWGDAATPQSNGLFFDSCYIDKNIVLNYVSSARFTDSVCNGTFSADNLTAASGKGDLDCIGLDNFVVQGDITFSGTVGLNSYLRGVRSITGMITVQGKVLEIETLSPTKYQTTQDTAVNVKSGRRNYMSDVSLVRHTSNPTTQKGLLNFSRAEDLALVTSTNNYDLWNINLDGSPNFGANTALTFNSYSDSTSAATRRLMLFNASGAIRIGSTVSDPGNTYSLYAEKLIYSTGGIKLPTFTFATLPVATVSSGVIVICTNTALTPTRQTVISDGTNWVYISDPSTIVSAAP